MPHAAQAERLVPAQRMVVVLQHWRAHLAELEVIKQYIQNQRG
ncbi:hypothetical protein VCX44_02260 [Aeromonas caviae]|uniref:Uncharacterized protein n=1 Tax=Aeromonas caviae TaxID=648 RepID=A0ABU5W1I0_AERCA|nr:hypothetical protein [Aeromonas caviae]MEA9434664.1 hypothetical protein [Aeromonas caviae]